MARKKHGKMSSHHTGRILHGDMGTYIPGVGGKDKHASSEHHSANAEHGMHDGMSPTEGYGGGGGEEGGEGMSGNCSYE